MPNAINCRSAVLLFACLQLLTLSSALVRTSINRTVSLSLAALLAMVVGLLVPDNFGFASLYDAFRWLSFAPFAIPLAVGPLFYLYVLGLTHDGQSDQEASNLLVYRNESAATWTV